MSRKSKVSNNKKMNKKFQAAKGNSKLKKVAPQQTAVDGVKDNSMLKKVDANLEQGMGFNFKADPLMSDDDAPHRAHESERKHLLQSAGVSPAKFSQADFNKDFLMLLTYFRFMSSSFLMYLTPFLLGCAGSLLSGLFLIQPFRNRPDFKVVSNMSGLVIGKSGTKKSPALNAVTKAIFEFEKSHMAQAANEISALNKQREVNKLCNRKINDELAKHQLALLSAEENEPERAVDISIAIDSLKQKLIDIEESTYKSRKLVVSSPTQMGLVRTLSEQSTPLILVKDEISDFIETTCGKTGNASRALLMVLMDGQGTESFERANRETVKLVDRSLAIFGSAQPDRLNNFVNKVITGDIPVDGFLSRFQLITAPTELKYSQPKAMSALTQEKMAKYWDNFIKDCNPFSAVANAQPLQRRTVYFTAEAEDIYRDRIKFNEERSEQLKPLHQSYVSKQQSTIASLALINAVFRQHSVANFDCEINADDVVKAIRQAHVFESHFTVFFKQIGTDSYLAVTLLEKLEKTKSSIDKYNFTVNAIYQQCWSGFKSKEAIKKALNILEEYSMVYKKHHENPKGGRPTEYWSLCSPNT